MRYLAAFFLFLTLVGCTAQTREVIQALDDRTVIEDLRKEIAALPEGHPDRVALEEKLAKIGDAQTFNEAVENVALGLGPAGTVGVVLWRLLRRRLARSETALRQVVTGVEAGGKTPTLKAALNQALDEDAKALVESYRAALPKPPEVEPPAVVTK